MGDHSAPRPPGRRGGRKVWLWVLLGAAVLGLLIAAGAALWLQRQFDPPGAPGDEVALTLAPGASTATLAAQLDDKGIVESAQLFKLYVRLKGGVTFQAGDYVFREGQAFGDILAVLRKGPQLVYQRLTIPEGFTLAQIADRVGTLPGRSRDRFLELANSGAVRSELQPAGSTNLEGLLFPDTYLFEEKDDEEAILRRMVGAFDEVAVEVGLADAAARQGRTPYELAIIASLVEREAKVADERGKVAQVIANRTAKGMLLQIDATVLYALGGHKERVLFRDLEVDSPYNTYKVKGLPPTPIAAAGRASLAAAANPEPGPWLYYVVIDAQGRHAFAETGAEHQANIRQAERNGVR